MFEDSTVGQDQLNRISANPNNVSYVSPEENSLQNTAAVASAPTGTTAQDFPVLNDAMEEVAKPPKPGFTDNIGGSVESGARAGVTDLMAGANKAFGWNFGTGLTPEEFQTASNDVQKNLIPDPAVTGWLGSNLAYPLSRLAVEAIPAAPTGLGGMMLVAGGARGNAKRNEMIGQGVDENTATKLGVAEGLMTAATLAVPGSVGETMVGRILSGAGINTALGAAQEGSVGKILRDNGYPEMADQYHVLDWSHRGAEALTGGLIGAIHPALAREPGHQPDFANMKDVTPPKPAQLELLDNGEGAGGQGAAPNSPAPLLLDKDGNQIHLSDLFNSKLQTYSGREIQPTDTLGSVEGGINITGPDGKPVHGYDTLDSVAGRNPYKNITTPDGAEIHPTDTLLSVWEKFGNQPHVDDFADNQRAEDDRQALADRFKNIRTPDGAIIKPTDTLKEVWDKYENSPNIHDIMDNLQGIVSDLRRDAPKPDTSMEQMQILPSDIDAAMAADNVHQLEIESAPGIPTDPATRNDHINAMTKAGMQVMSNDDVNLGDTIKNTNFLPHPVDPVHDAEIKAALKDSGFHELTKTEPAPQDNQPTLFDPAKVPESTESATHTGSQVVNIGGHEIEVPNVEITHDENGLNIKMGKAGEAAEKPEAQKAPKDLTKEIIAEKPDLQIMNEDGSVQSAADALKEANEQAAQAEQDSGLFEVAVNCFLRNGYAG